MLAIVFLIVGRRLSRSVSLTVPALTFWHVSTNFSIDVSGEQVRVRYWFHSRDGKR